ncbi:MAG: hypothetical protein AAGC46_05610 [Solirubrobacteraceae bacterium]
MLRGRPAHLAASLLGAAALVAAGAPAVSAATTTYRGTANDPAHDSTSTAAGLDITQVRAQYKTDGSVVFTLVTRGRIDGSRHDAAFAVFLGTGGCSKVFAGGGGLLSQPDAPVAFTATSQTKLGKQRPATGRLGTTSFQVRATYAAFAGKAPDCFTGALVNPKKNNAVIDQVSITGMTR